MRVLSVDTINGVHVMRVARRRWWWPFSAVEEEWFMRDKPHRCPYYNSDWHPARHHAEWFLVKSGEKAGCHLSIGLCDLWDQRLRHEDLLAQMSKGLDERIKQLDVN